MEKLSDEEIKIIINSLPEANDSGLWMVDIEDTLSLCTELLELRKEVARLREALKPFAKARWGNDEDGWLLAKGIQHVEVTNARAALNPKVDE